MLLTTRESTLVYLRRSITFGFAVGLLSSLAVCPAFAWNVYPLKLDWNLKPGESATQVFMVDNSDSSEGRRIEIVPVDWILDSDGGLTMAKPGTYEHSLNSSLTFSPRQMKLGPGERKEVRVTISASKEIKSGEHTFGLEVLQKQLLGGTNQTGKVQLNINLQSGYLVTTNVSVPETTVNPVEVLDLAVLPANGKMPTRANLKIKNTSNVRVRPQWSFNILDGSGKIVFEFKPQEQIFLRESEHSIVVALPKDLPAGQYSLTGRLDQGKSFAVQELGKTFSIDKTAAVNKIAPAAPSELIQLKELPPPGAQKKTVAPKVTAPSVQKSKTVVPSKPKGTIKSR